MYKYFRINLSRRSLTFTNKRSFSTSKFQIPENFLANYKTKKVNFGFNGLGELVYKRTYSRMKENNTNEEWYETVQRVVEGTYNLLMYFTN